MSLSPQEKARLRDLQSYQILDTPEEQEYDDLARLASRICGQPISQINFIDGERQWTKASVPPTVKELPREGTFCYNTIQQDEWMIVPDTHKDDRFRKMPYVQDEPGIRFYAGVNLKSQNGYNLGTICVLGTEPGELTDQQLESLKILASEVETRLELHRQKQTLKAKNERLEQLSTFLKNSTDLVLMIDPDDGTLLEVNPQVESFLGYTADELTGSSLATITDGDALEAEFNRALETGSDFEKEMRFRTKSDDTVWMRVHMTEQDGVRYATARNITQRKRAHNRLQKKEQELSKTLSELKNAQRLAHMGNWELDLTEMNMKWSDEVYEIYGIEPEAFTLTPETLMEQVHPDDREKVSAVFRNIPNNAYDEFEHRILTGNGNIKYVIERGEVTYAQDGTPLRVNGTIQDITRRRRQEERIEQSLHEKEVLLSEIHHRVKNNLAIISGLLQMEVFNNDDPSARRALENSQSRIQSMAMVHELLYQSGDFTNVPFTEFVDKILEHLNNLHQPGEQGIRIETDIAEVKLNVNQAIPVALILTELISNAYKHAFDDDGGQLDIVLNHSNRHITFSVADNGKGLPEDFDIETSESLGFTLVNTLTTQVEADLEVQTQPGQGTRFELQFEMKNKKGSSSAHLGV